MVNKNMCDCNQGRLPCSCKAEHVPPAGGDLEVIVYACGPAERRQYLRPTSAFLGYFDGQAIPLVDRAHVTRLQAEVGRLATVLKDRSTHIVALDNENKTLQSELTKARELLKEADNFMYIMTGHDSHARLVHQYGKEWWTPVNELRGKICTALSNQSAPPDKG